MRFGCIFSVKKSGQTLRSVSLCADYREGFRERQASGGGKRGVAEDHGMSGSIGHRETDDDYEVRLLDC